jgi:hypothetical protein
MSNNLQNIGIVLEGVLNTFFPFRKTKSGSSVACENELRIPSIVGHNATNVRTSAGSDTDESACSMSVIDID